VHLNREGYEKGRADGFQRGRQEGFARGLEDASRMRNAAPVSMISEKWRDYRFSEKLAGHFGSSVALVEENQECLKETDKSSIWKLEIRTVTQTVPLILKIFKAPIEGPKWIELNTYRKASLLLSDLMPAVYWTEDVPDTNEVWAILEYVPQLKGQIIFTPDCFDKIIPSLAKLHARTHNDRLFERWDLFSEWLPLYHSDTAIAERVQTRDRTLEYLDKAMEHPEWRSKLKPQYDRLQRLLSSGPEYFPELAQAGKSVIHNDLQTPNIGCGNVQEESWNLKFLDWEGARFAPCWFDMFNLIGIFFAYRKDWRSAEEEVVARCAPLYASEMSKHGVRFEGDPVRLYKMAYLQRVLEKSLFLQLQWAVEAQKPAFLLDGYLDKIKGWGKELGLHVK
jgi:Phosphotransferase enzyme family.